MTAWEIELYAPGQHESPWSEWVRAVDLIAALAAGQSRAHALRVDLRGIYLDGRRVWSDHR
jgi:hypothetical protein